MNYINPNSGEIFTERDTDLGRYILSLSDTERIVSRVYTDNGEIKYFITGTAKLHPFRYESKVHVYVKPQTSSPSQSTYQGEFAAIQFSSSNPQEG